MAPPLFSAELFVNLVKAMASGHTIYAGREHEEIIAPPLPRVA